MPLYASDIKPQHCRTIQKTKHKRAQTPCASNDITLLKNPSQNQKPQQAGSIARAHRPRVSRLQEKDDLCGGIIDLLLCIAIQYPECLMRMDESQRDEKKLAINQVILEDITQHNGKMRSHVFTKSPSYIVQAQLNAVSLLNCEHTCQIICNLGYIKCFCVKCIFVLVIVFQSMYISLGVL